MQIIRKDTGTLQSNIALTLEVADYQPKFQTELKNYKNKAQIKGFRKGMTPDSLIKKMYGKSILADIVNESLQEKLFGYLDENKINYIGQPLPSKEDNLLIDLDPNNLKDYTFHFDIGLAPSLTIDGVSNQDHYTQFDVQITDSIIDDEVEAVRKRFGKRENVTDSIQENDMVKFKATELDSDSLKENGWVTEFSVLVSVIDDTSVKNELLSKKVGESIDFNVYTLENRDETYINKYILNKNADDTTEIGNMFRGDIIEVTRLMPAEFNEELFSQFPDENIIDEQSLREFLLKDLKAYYDSQTMNFMFRDIMDAIMDKNQVELPEEFLKRYLLETNEKVTEAIVEEEFGQFAKNMKWSLIKNELAKKYQIQVEEKDIRNHFIQSVFSYMRNYGNMDYSFINSTVDRMMKDKDQVNKAYEEILSDKILHSVANEITIDRESISYEDFAEKVKALNERINNL